MQQVIEDNRLTDGSMETIYNWIRTQWGRREVILNEIVKQRRPR